MQPPFNSIYAHGYVRAAVCIPFVRVADPEYNAEQTLGLALASESPANARVIRTPFARLGVLTSKDAWMPDVVERLAQAGKQVVVTGLDRDFRGIPFGTMPRLLALADQVTKLTAICMACGEPATRTQRLIDGQPAPADSPLIVIGGMGDETYEARCRLHHEVPGLSV